MAIESCPAAFFSNLVSSSVRSVIHQKRDMAPALLPSVSSVLIKVYVEQEVEQRGFLLETQGQHLHLHWFQYGLLKTFQYVWTILANALQTQSRWKQDANTGLSAQGGVIPEESYPLVFTFISSLSVLHPACFEPIIWTIDLINYSMAGNLVITTLIGWWHHKKVHSPAGGRENTSPFYTFKSPLKQII